jgi:hypothetical protein
MHLVGVHLTGVYLMGVHLMRIHFIRMHLIGVHLTGICLMSVYLIGATCQTGSDAWRYTTPAVPSRWYYQCSSPCCREETA